MEIFDEVLVEIQNAALDNSNDNRMSKVVSEWQAYNIAYRSAELQNERDRYEITPKEKAKQMDICWKKQYRQRN